MTNENLNDIALRLQSIIDTAIDGIITIDNRGIVETVNKAAAAQFQYDPSEIIGNNIKMLMPEPYHSEHDNYIHRYTKTKQPRIIGIGREVIGKKKNGDHFPFSLAVSEVILNDRVIFTGIIHDLTNVRIAEKELIKLNAQLEDKVEQRTSELELTVNKLLETNKTLAIRESELEASLNKEKDLNELKSRFVSMASHEFRTPLSTILSSASLISKYVKEEDNEKRVKHVGRIKSAVNNLTGILNDFLSLSKIEEGKEKTEHQIIYINDLFNEVFDELKGLLKSEQKLKLIQANPTLKIESDKRILKNILFNLISNAIKYSQQNGEIICEVEEKEKELKFTVKDNGIGIPKSEQKYLFDRFFRATNVETIQGTGLGLHIVKRYVELLGGNINFISEENKGSQFYFSLIKN